MSNNYFQECPAEMETGFREISDYRTANVREQNNKYINGLGSREDDYRSFLQQNGRKIMKNEWDMMRRKQTCQTNACIHNYPTRVHPSTLFDEMEMYNKVRRSKMTERSKEFPNCRQLEDYRASII